MIRAKTIDAEEEKDLLQEWFDTVQFDEESEGIPNLEPEEDDEESRHMQGKHNQDAHGKGGSSAPNAKAPRTSTRVSNSVVDERVGELQRKEPDKYWKVAETHEGAKSYKLSNEDGTTAGHYALYDNKDHVEFGTLVAEPGQRGIAKSALDDLDNRVPDKVQRLDAFDGELTTIYSKYGFKETSRVQWDDQYAPSSWKSEYGRPDVVFMERPSAVDRGVQARSHPF